MGLLIGTVLAVSVAAGCRRASEVVLHPRNGAAVRVPVELALTPEARSRGLMYRRDLPANAGMIFVFPITGELSFWMKNTPLPLDIIFIGEDLVVAGIVERAVPFDERPLGVKRRSRYVLEVHAGFAQRHGLSAGDRVEFVGVPAAAS